TSNDVMVLANLCHDCRACYQACMYAPPHEFGVDLPLSLGQVRTAGYRATAWPGALRPLFDRPLLANPVALALGVLAAVVMAALTGNGVLGKSGDERGSFYRVVSANLMTGVFLALGLIVFAILMGGLRSVLRGAAEARPVRLTPREVVGALWEAVT